MSRRSLTRRHCSTTVALRARAAGFSLVELMVAMVISLILLGGVIQIYLGSRQSYRVQDSQARLQENGRFAMYYLTKDIRMAGYMGCNRLADITPNVVANSPVPSFSPDTVLLGGDPGTWPTSYSANGPTIAQPANWVPGTSTIMVRYASPASLTLVGNMSTTNANIQINANPNGYQANDVLFVTDCSSADIFRATNVSQGANGTVTIAHSNAMNTANFLSKAYQTDAQVMSFDYALYYIGTTATPGVNALYRQDMTQTQELVDGVQDMRLLFGLDTTGDGAANEYDSATKIDALGAAGWPSVVSVRVRLLLATAKDNLIQAGTARQQYLFNGTTVTAPDGRLYAPFGDTVTVRNRTM